MTSRTRRRRDQGVKRVEVAVLGGEVLAANYTPQEFAAMSGMRARGVPPEELRLLHEAKAVLDARLEPEPGDPPACEKERRCHLCQASDRPLLFVPQSRLWFCAGEVGGVWCKHRARCRIGVDIRDSLALLLEELPDWYPRERIEERLIALGPGRRR